MTITDLTSLFAVIGSAIAIYLAYRKAPHEESSLDAGTAKTYEEAAALAGERANRLDKEIDELRAENHVQNKTIKEQGTLIDMLVGKDAEKEKRIRFLEVENGNLRDWASRLVIQVEDLGGTPVKLREIR